jgi:hypothetical protein
MGGRRRVRAAGAGRGDRLPVVVIDDVTGSEDAWDARDRAPRRDLDVPMLSQVNLSLEKAGIRRVPDGNKWRLGRFDD